MLTLPLADHAQLTNPAHPLVVAQVQFGSPVAEITAEALAAFQHALQSSGLDLSVVKPIHGGDIVIGPGIATATNTLAGYQVSSPDGLWFVALTNGWVSLETPAFTTFATDFSVRLEYVLRAATETIRPVAVSRAGLRFVNILSRPEGDAWSGWIRESLIAVAEDTLLADGLVGHAQQLLFDVAPDRKSVVRCGPVADESGAPRFMLDIDTYAEPGAVWNVDAIAAAFSDLNESGVALFQTLITTEMLAHLQGK